MIPTVNETLTRVPVGHPLAKGPTDPLIAQTLLIILQSSKATFFKPVELNLTNERLHPMKVQSKNCDIEKSLPYKSQSMKVQFSNSRFLTDSSV